MNRCKKLFTDLRQACCDPQVVRAKDQQVATRRRSMQSIMMDLVAKAYQTYDAALRNLLQLKAVLGALRLQPGKPSTSTLPPCCIMHCNEECMSGGCAGHLHAD